MDKQAFLTELAKQLKSRGVADIDGIVEEYEDHFNFKLADGFAEAEIAARLGSPTDIAGQYAPAGEAKPRRRSGRRIAAATALVFLFLIVVGVFVLFFGWVIVLGALAIACAALGVCLIGDLNIAALIPNMPSFGAAVMGVASLALALLAGVGTVYCWRYALQVVKAYFHWNKRCLDSAAGRPVSPAIALAPQFKPRTRRVMRRLTGLSLLVFGTGFVLGFIIMSIDAGAFGFWHVWRWFGQ